MTRGSLCTSNQFAHASFFSHGLEERSVQIRSICPVLTNRMLDDFLIALMWLAAGSYHLFDKLLSILRTIGKAIFDSIFRKQGVPIFHHFNLM